MDPPLVRKAILFLAVEGKPRYFLDRFVRRNIIFHGVRFMDTDFLVKVPHTWVLSFLELSWGNSPALIIFSVRNIVKYLTKRLRRSFFSSSAHAKMSARSRENVRSLAIKCEGAHEKMSGRSLENVRALAIKWQGFRDKMSGRSRENVRALAIKC